MIAVLVYFNINYENVEEPLLCCAILRAHTQENSSLLETS